MAEFWKKLMRHTVAEQRRDEWWDRVGTVLFTDGTEAAIEEMGRGYRYRTYGAEWASLRTMIFERDNFTCQYCGAHGGRLECDHIIPVARGGSDDESNLLTACFACNRSKGALLVSEWRPDLCQ